MATTPALLAHLVDGATTDVDGGSRLADAVAAFRRHREAWYGGALGLLVVRASAAPQLAHAGIRAGGAPAGSSMVAGLSVAVVADTGLDRLGEAVSTLRSAGAGVRRVEYAVAKRGEDPVPGVRRLLAATEDSLSNEETGAVAVHAEVPLTGGLLDALDVIAARPGAAGPAGVTFRVGGLAGELFPTPTTLAGVICACRDRGLRFTVSAGLRKALRHNDHETGFSHHGVLNVLAASLAAASGAGSTAVAERLAMPDPVPVVEAVRSARDAHRPLLTAFTSGRVADTIADLELFEVLSRDSRASDNPAR